MVMNITPPTLFLSIFLSLILVPLLTRALKKDKKMRPKKRFVFYKPMYADKKPRHPKKHMIYGKVFESDTYNVRGKPDYILKHKIFTRFIPIEIKSGSIKDKKSPHKGDLMQLAVYFLLLEENFSKPPFGFITYKDASFKIYNTHLLKKELLETIKSMENALTNGGKDLMPNQSFVTCRYCVCKHTVCEWQE